MAAQEPRHTIRESAPREHAIHMAQKSGHKDKCCESRLVAVHGCTWASQLSQAHTASGCSNACLHFQTPNPGPLVGSKGKPKFLQCVQGAPYPDTRFNPPSAKTPQRTRWGRGVSPHLGTVGGGEKRPRTLGREGQCAAHLGRTATSLRPQAQ